MNPNSLPNPSRVAPPLPLPLARRCDGGRPFGHPPFQHHDFEGSAAPDAPDRATRTAIDRRRVHQRACADQRRCDDRKNGLLASMPDAEFESLRPHLRLVTLKANQVLSQPGERPTQIYFPVTAIVSLSYTTAEGESLQMGVVGHDGVVGIGLLMGGGAMTSQAVVQGSGTAYALPAWAMRDAFDRGGAVQRLMLRYALALLTQMSYTAACNRHHTIYQQLCRWLLRHIELTRGHEFVMTQEAIANGMGVRRESVTEAAGQLRSLHAISWQRGRIVVLDRDALERGTCECHAAVSREYRRLLPPQTAA